MATFVLIHGAGDLGWYWHFALSKERSESDTALNSPWPLDALPAVPTRFVVCTEDLFSPHTPTPLMRRVAGERLGIGPDEIARRATAWRSAAHTSSPTLLDSYARAPVT